MVAAITRIGSGRLRRWRGRIGTVAFLAGVSYLVLLPLFRVQTLALEDGAEGYRMAYTRPSAWATLRTTIALALGSLVIALVLGTLMARAAHHLPRRLRLLRVIPAMSIVVPGVANIVGWTLLLSPRPGYLNAWLRKLPWWSGLTEGPVDIYTLPWIVILTGFSLMAFVYLFVSAGLRSINAELVEAAHVSGASRLHTFFTVELPLLRPALVYGGSTALLLGLGQFTAPLLLGRTAGIDVLTTDMYIAMSQTPVRTGMAAAIASPLLLFGIAVVIFQKSVLAERARYITHAGKSFTSPNRTTKTSALVIVIYAIVAIGLPVYGLTAASLSKFWTADVDFDALTLKNFRTIADDPRITEAIFTSLSSSIVAIAIALPLGFVAARILRKPGGGPIRTAIDFVVSLPLGIPAAVFGIGFLVTYINPPIVLYGTRWVIIVTYVTLSLPFSTRMQLTAMSSLGEAYVESSRVSGASELRTSIKVLLPMMRGTIGGASALMFVLLTHEFAASLLVRSPTTNVMGTILYDYWYLGSYPLVASIALLMSVITAAGVLLAMVVGGTGVFDKL